MAYLIQLLLPLRDNQGDPFPPGMHGRVKNELKEKFGGVTAYNRSAAEGQWKTDQQEIHDELIVYEVMTPEVDSSWWTGYRSDLENRFKQEEVVIRALTIQRL